MPDSQNPLPEGWTEHKTKAGKLYYYHAATKKSSWKDPRPVSEVFTNDGSFMERIRAMQAAAAAADGGNDPSEKSDVIGKTSAALPVDMVPDRATPAVDTSNNAAHSKTEPKGEQLVRDAAAGGVGSKRKPQAESNNGNDDKKSRNDSSKPTGKASRFKATTKESSTDAAQEYQKQVQMLMAMDKQTDSTGGKWLVR